MSESLEQTFTRVFSKFKPVPMSNYAGFVLTIDGVEKCVSFNMITQLLENHNNNVDLFANIKLQEVPKDAFTGRIVY